MVPDSTAPSTTAASLADRDTSTAVNGLLGGLVGVVLSFVPLSTVLGGAVAGYLEGGRPEDGLKAGAIAGLVMFVPIAFVLYLFLLIVLGLGGAPTAFGIAGIVVLFVSLLYTLGFGILGGYLGTYLRDEL